MSKQKSSGQSLGELYTQLNAIIAWFDQDDFDVDEALTKFDQGMQLADLIRGRLKAAEHKLTLVQERFNEQTGEQ